MIELAGYLAGFVAAEGSFIATTSKGKPSFAFAVALGATDESMVQLLYGFFGCGTIQRAPRRQAHFDDEVRFQVRKLADLVDIIVPFMDEHLPPSHKRAQFVEWRAALLSYWQHDARRRRPCTVDGCDVPQRAKGLCRSHYHRAYGR